MNNVIIVEPIEDWSSLLGPTVIQSMKHDMLVSGEIVELNCGFRFVRCDAQVDLQPIRFGKKTAQWKRERRGRRS